MGIMMLDDWIKRYCYASIEEAQESGDGGTAAIEAVASAVDGYEKVENCQIGVNGSAFSLAKAGFMIDREIIDFDSGLKLNDSYSRTYSYQRSSSCRNPEAINMLTKSSWIGKRTQRTLRFSKHWAVLKGSALSWYENERDPYFPQGHIDLRHALNCDPSNENHLQFTVGTVARKFIFNVDSEESRDDWVKVIRKALLRSHNEGESVRISIPLETIVDLDTNSSSSLTSFNSENSSEKVEDSSKTDMVCLKVVDDHTDEFAVDEYYFLHFLDQDFFLQKLRNGMNEMLQREGSLVDSNLTTGTRIRRSGVLDTTVSTKGSIFYTIDQASTNESIEELGKEDGKEQVEAKEELTSEIGEDPTSIPEAGASFGAEAVEDHHLPVDSSSAIQETPSNTDATLSLNTNTDTPSSNTYPPSPSSTIPPSSFSRFQKDSEKTWMVPRWMRETPGRLLSGSNISKLPFPRRRVMEAWSTLSSTIGESSQMGAEGFSQSGPASRGFDLDESGHLAFSVVDVEETAPALEKEELVEKHFRECFAVPQEEKLLAHLSASLYRVLPSAGRLFISASYLCFRSSRLASKTVGRTLVSPHLTVQAFK